MSARVSIRDLWGGLLPVGCTDGFLAMLRAYFDDSGTHGPSEVVVVAGIMGTESELLSLEGMWREHLDSPLCGLKPRIHEFHAVDCDNSDGAFRGWKRKETDYFRHQLREIIIRSHVSGYGFACIRRQWDDEIQGDLRGWFGDAERYSISNCFVRSLRWARQFTIDPEISFIFDNRPQSERETRAVFDAFQRHEHDKNIIGISFLNSAKILPLQAADLFAWEFNRYARKILKYGINAPTPKESIHLKKGMYYLDGQVTDIEAIRKIKHFALEQYSTDVIGAVADHFRTFGLPTDGEKKGAKRRRERLS